MLHRRNLSLRYLLSRSIAHCSRTSPIYSRRDTSKCGKRGRLHGSTPTFDVGLVALVGGGINTLNVTVGESRRTSFAARCFDGIAATVHKPDIVPQRKLKPIKRAPSPRLPINRLFLIESA